MGEGRDVSSQYGRRDETCPVSTGGGAGGGREVGGREQPLGVALPEHARDAAHLGGRGLRARARGTCV